MTRIVCIQLLLFCFFITAISIPALSSTIDKVHQVNAYLEVEALQDNPLKRVYLSSFSSNEARLLELRRELIVQGARMVNFFPPSLLVFEIPPDRSLESLLDDPDFHIVEEYQLGDESAESAVFSPAWVKRCYSTATRLSQPVQIPGTVDGSFEYDFKDVVRVIPKSVVKRIQASAEKESNGDSKKNVNQNSEFMVGSILLQLVFPESNGRFEEDLEEWSNAELSDVISGAIAAMLNFQEQFSYVPINFIFRYFERVPTRYEPITHNMNDDDLWVMDVMNNLGYDLKEDIAAVHAFNNDGKEYYGTDWVYTAFVANSENAPRHRFNTTSYTAYAYLGGPYFVMPYPAGENPFGIDQVLVYSQIFQHEAAHIFWALDEYPSSLGTCDSWSGYLNVQNMNKSWVGGNGEIASCQEVVPCIMDRAKEDLGRPICAYTAGQMGFALNQLGIPKVFDSPPIVEFENADIETVDTNDLTIRLKAISTAVPNRNPAQEVEDRISYAAPLKDAVFNVDGVGTIKIFPEDGKWDEIEEDIVVRLSSIRTGLIQVGVSVRNAAGRASSFYVKKIYNTGLNYAHFFLDEHEDGIKILWNMVGDTFGASFDLHRIGPAPLREDRIIAHNLAPSDTISPQFLEFSYFDRDVVPGKSYRYYVMGTYTINMGGSPRTYTSSSSFFTATAMLPISKGSITSYPSPNPFNPARGKLHVSINIPPSFPVERDEMVPQVESLGNARASQAISGELTTKVNVDIYDVLGRHVRGLYSRNEYSGVLTIDWDGTSNKNVAVPSGVYFLRVQAGPFTEVKKLLLLR